MYNLVSWREVRWESDLFLGFGISINKFLKHLVEIHRCLLYALQISLNIAD